MRARDSQRKRVYVAERVLSKFAKPLRDVQDIERFLKKQLQRKAILRRYPDATKKVRVSDGRGRVNACAYGDWKIAIPLWARNTHIVVHEMAHIVTHRQYGHRVAGHGWEYASVFLDLVRFIMGKEAHDALKQSFKDNKVRFTKPRTRKPLSPEAKAALALRLAEARAKITS